MKFEDKDINQALKKYFGFEKFKGEQREIVKSVLHGQNTFVIMPTGGGKSLCYQLPAMMMEGTAIIISPLIALMKNQVDYHNLIVTHLKIRLLVSSSLYYYLLLYLLW